MFVENLAGDRDRSLAFSFSPPLLFPFLHSLHFGELPVDVVRLPGMGRTATAIVNNTNGMSPIAMCNRGQIMFASPDQKVFYARSRAAKVTWQTGSCAASAAGNRVP